FMDRHEKHYYEFGPFRLQVHERLLLRDGEIVPLAPKAIDLLVALVENSSHVLSKDELMKQVWPDTVVEEANLSHQVFTLRKVLEEDKHGAKYIETIPRRGYRFVASVNEWAGEQADLIVQEHSRSRIVIEEERVDAPAVGAAAEALANQERAVQVSRRAVGGARWLQGRKLAL